MAERTTDTTSEPIPFGAMEPPTKGEPGDGKKDWRRQENKRGSARRGGRRRRKPPGESDEPSEPGESGETQGATQAAAEAPESPKAEQPSRSRKAPARDRESAEAGVSPATETAPAREGERQDGERPDGERQEGDRPRRRRRRRRRGGAGGEGQGGERSEPRSGRPDRQGGESPARRGRSRGRPGQVPEDAKEITGMFVQDKGGFGTLRSAERQFMPGKDDVWVAKHLAQKNKLSDGAMVTGKVSRGQGKHKYQLLSVETVDGKQPDEVANLVPFKKLTSIDPDFHYEVGDISDDVSMRILDVICPIGRGTRGLLVAPPRSGKTIILRKFAAALEKGYPDVHLMVLLVDERPEEATEWQRSVKNGQVFVSTNDEMAKHHVQLAEAVWKRATRLVELGEDVVILLDSITRLARAYNNATGGSGRTMSGGIDSRTMEKPRAFFGSARNTETAGSLTILGSALVETGSRMDQVIFEEFKGTGNMELVLSRKLADRRIFPAIDVERSGTRKEEKLLSARKLRRTNTLRRVLLKMNFIEAMELLVGKLEDVEKTNDFLERFEVDPEA